MKMVFEVEKEERYKEEHELFMLHVLSRDKVGDIEYVGAVPLDTEIVKFSTYLELHGYMRMGKYFVGYGGKLTYSQALVDFLYYARDTYGDKKYKIEIDVQEVSQMQDKADLAACIEILYG